MVIHRSTTLFIVVAVALGIALTNCSQTSNPNDDAATFNGADYMWQPSLANARYRITSGGNQTTLTLSFLRAGDTARVLHTIYSAGMMTDSIEMRYAFRASPFDLSAFTAATLFRMPLHTTMPPKNSIERPEMLSVHAVPSGEFFAGTKSHGILKYSGSTNSWQRLALATVPNITMLASDEASPSPRMFAATPEGKLFFSPAPYTGWFPVDYPGAHITDFTVMGDGKIILIDGSTIIESDFPFSQWSSHRVAYQLTSVGHITLDPALGSNLYGYILYGTSNGTIVQDEVAFGAAQHNYTEMIGGLGSIDRIVSSRKGYFPIGTIAAGHSVWAGIPYLWMPIMQLTAAINDLVLMETSPSFYYATDQGIFSSDPRDSTQVKLDGLIGEQVKRLAVSDAWVKIALTRTASYRGDVGSGKWTAIDDGIVSASEPAALSMLLPTLKVGSVWQAGTLLLQPPSQQVQWKPITARVMHHLDELRTSNDAARFSDVIVVRYGVEQSNGDLDPSALHWLVYYARNVGPVLIEDFEKGKLFNRIEWSN